jgi:hypothetical protein
MASIGTVQVSYLKIIALRWIRMFLIPLLSGNLLLWLSMPIFAEARKGLTSEISLSVGWERLEYEEHEPVKGIESEVETDNLVLGVEGIKRWKHLFCGAKTVFPVSLGDDREKVTLSGTAYQTNTLELRWIRAAGFVGYPWSNWANPYFGVRW